MTWIDWIYFPLLFANTSLSIIRWRQFSSADRYIGTLLCLTTLSELIAREMAHRYLNNLLLYRIYNILALLLVTLYFHRSVFVFGKSITKWTALSIVIVFFCAAIWVLPVSPEGNADFLLIQATLIILFCLFSIRRILLQMNSQPPFQFAQFWLTCAFLLYWSLTFSGWGTIYFVDSVKNPLYTFFIGLVNFANFGFYTATALILFFYKKLIHSGE